MRSLRILRPRRRFIVVFIFAFVFIFLLRAALTNIEYGVATKTNVEGQQLNLSDAGYYRLTKIWRPPLTPSEIFQAGTGQEVDPETSWKLQERFASASPADQATGGNNDQETSFDNAWVVANVMAGNEIPYSTMAVVATASENPFFRKGDRVLSIATREVNADNVRSTYAQFGGPLLVARGESVDLLDDVSWEGVSFRSGVYGVNTRPAIVTSERSSGGSGGLLYTLAYHDFLTEKDFLQGRKVAATGKIFVDGTVGAVGSVEIKTRAAVKLDADVLFVPAENYKSAKIAAVLEGSDLEVVGVSSSVEAVEWLAEPV